MARAPAGVDRQQFARPANVGHIVVTVTCKCGSVLVWSSAVPEYRCPRRHPTKQGRRFRITKDGIEPE